MENSVPRPGSTQSGNTSSAWMVSFADLLSLILTFFVLMYSMSAIVEPKWHKVKESLTERLNPDHESPEILFTAKKSISTVYVKNATELSYLYSLIQEKMKAASLDKMLKLERRDNSLAIILPGNIAFVDGESILSPKAKEALHLLEDILHQINNQVDIYGYASPSERGLSISRAIAVAKGLLEFGYDYQVKAFGVSLSSKSKKELYGGSQRVDIIIHNKKAKYVE